MCPSLGPTDRLQPPGDMASSSAAADEDRDAMFFDASAGALSACGLTATVELRHPKTGAWFSAGAYPSGGAAGAARAHMHPVSGRVYVLADPGSGGDEGQRFRISLRNDDPTEPIGYKVSVDGADAETANVSKWNFLQNRNHKSQRTIEGFMAGSSVISEGALVRPFAFSMKEEAAAGAPAAGGGGGGGGAAMRPTGCTIRVEVVRFVKRTETRAPEIVTTTLGGLTKAVAGTVTSKKAAAFGLGVGVALPDDAELKKAAASLGREPTTKAVAISHDWPPFAPQPPDGVLGISPNAVLEFFVRDAGVHRHSTVDEIENGVLPAVHGSVSLSGGGGGGGKAKKGPDANAAAAAAAAASKKSAAGGVTDLTSSAPAAKKAKADGPPAAAIDLSDEEEEEEEEEEGGEEKK